MTALDKAISALEEAQAHLVDVGINDNVENVPRFINKRLDKDISVLKRLRSHGEGEAPR